jgi:hypothetical protein
MTTLRPVFRLATPPEPSYRKCRFFQNYSECFRERSGLLESRLDIVAPLVVNEFEEKEEGIG